MTSPVPVPSESPPPSWSGSTLGFGVIGPIACVLLAAYLSEVRSFFQMLGLRDVPPWLGLYIAAAIAVLRPTQRRAVRSSLSAGYLAGAGAFALLVALVLAPFSFLGLVFGIGVLGFIPFGTGVVYLREAARVMRRAPRPFAARRCAGALLGLALSLAPFVPPYACVQLTQRAVDDVASGEPARVEAGLARVELLGVFAWGNTVWDGHRHLGGPDLRDRLQQAFERATGREIWEYAPTD